MEYKFILSRRRPSSALPKLPRGTQKSFTLFSTVKTTTKLNLGHSDKFEIEILKISRRGSRPSDNAEFSHFTLLFCRGRQRNVPRIITHVHSHWSAH